VYLPPSDSSGRDFGVVDMMTMVKKKTYCRLSVRRTGNGASTRRTVRARSTIFQPIALCSCNGDEMSGKTLGRMKEKASGGWRSIVRVGFTWPTHETNTEHLKRTSDIDKSKTNDRTTGTADRRGMNGRQSASRITTRDDAANTATRRMHARAAVTKNHRRRVAAGVRAPVVLLLWFPPTHPPADGQQTRRRRNNIIIVQVRWAGVTRSATRNISMENWPAEHRPMFFGPYYCTS